MAKKKEEKKRLKLVIKKEKAEIASEKKKKELHEQEVKAREILKKLEKARSKRKERHDESVQKLESAMHEILNISPELWISKDKSLDELISKLTERHQVSQQVQERGSLDGSMLLQSASGGKALQGVLLTKKFEDQLEDREQLLAVPENVLITGESQAEDKIYQFSSRLQEDTFKRSVDVLGLSFAVSGSAPVCGTNISVGTSMSYKAEEESTQQSHKRETYLSTVKYSTMQVASYSFRRNDLKLSDDAKRDLLELQRLIKAKDSDMEEACERFFKTYGSHVNMGTLKFGGNLRWICSSRGLKRSERESVKMMHSDAISICADFSIAGFGISSEVNIDKVKGLYEGKCKDSTIASTHLQVNVKGGPPEATDLPLWKSGLVANNSTWILTDRGGKLIPVWDIIRRNHAELGDAVDSLRDSWEKMTGLVAERELSIRLSYNSETVLDEVSEWNERESLTLQEIEDNLKYLLNVKMDIRNKAGTKSIWMNEYLSDVHLQNFFGFVVAASAAHEATDFGHIKFLMESLIELEELKQFDTRTFPNIGPLYNWLYKSAETAGNHSLMTQDVADFENFDEFLQKALEKERIDQLISGEMFTVESKMRIAVIVSKALHCLRSYYHETYDDILITVLVHPYQSGNCDNIISLHPMSLDDLETMLRLFSEQRAEFNKYLTYRPLHFQAYLFKLAADLCSEQSEFKLLKEQIIRMMRDLSSPLEQDIQQCLDQQDLSLSVLKDNLQHLLTKPLHRQILIMSKGKCSLSDVLKVEAHQQVVVHGGHVPSVLHKNPLVQNLFEKLGMTAFYPKKLCLRDALCIRPEPLELSLNNSTPTDLKQLPNLVLHKLMVYDVNCRSKSVPKVENAADNDDYDDKLETSSDGVHPVDVIIALFHCSDNFLRQDLLSRLAKCQLSVPFILPDPITNQLTIPLWALRSIIKDWKSTNANGKIEPQAHSIIQYPMPIVSFIGFGKQKQGKSKSIILNEVVCEFHSHFFHRDCPGGHNDCLLGQGLVDMSWYLPAGQTSDIFPDAVTFLNLHGDARQHPQQSKFLGQISSMCFVLLTEEVRETNSETIKILKMFSSCPGGITLLDTIGKKPEVIMKEISGVQAIKLTNKNASDIKHSVRGQIRKKMKDLMKLQSLETCCLKKEKISTDEDSETYKESFALAIKVKKFVASGKKDALLPLQGPDLWQAWAENNRELYRQSHRGARMINEYTAEILSRKEELRSKQLEKVDSLTPVMKSFLTSLLTLGGPQNTTRRNYFLQCLKLELNSISRESITDLQQQYQNTKQELAKLQDKTKSQEKDFKDKIEDCKKRLRILQDSIINNSVGLEHFFRELGQIYEAAVVSPSYKQEDSLSRLPKAAAELLIDGYPLEVMDGDAAHVPLEWFTAVLREAVEILGNPKIFVMSVLGLQSTGKSTMLNTAFGLQFNVSAGRCTRGAFIQLLPLDEKLKQTTECSYVLVVDTEGLRAPELDSLKTQKHDNELATFVIGLANMTLINIFGEVPGDMDDILQTSVHAFLRMSQVKFHPSCQFVHQNAGTNIKSEVGRSKFTEKLNKFTVDASREEHCEGQYETFNDVIKFDSEKDVHHFQGLWKGDPPMAPVNEGYSQCAQKLKFGCIKVLQKHNYNDFDLSSFNTRATKLWQNLLRENFVFSFKNTLEIAAYNSLEAEYSKWDWEFREGMLEWEQTLDNEIKTAEDSKAVHDLIQKKRENMRREVIPKFYEPFKAKMDTFFKGKQADILVQWKAKFDRRLNNLKSELEERAEKRCTNLRESIDAISKIKNDQANYTKIITAKVKEHIAILKQDQKKLSQNLEKGHLEPSQVKDILKREPFTPEKVDLYKQKKIITPEEADNINMFLNGSQLTEEHLHKIMFGGILELKQVKIILKNSQLTKEELKANFDQIWIEIVNKIAFVAIKEIEVEREVEDMLVAFLYDSKGKLIDLLRKKDLSERSDLHLGVEEGRHYNKVKGGIVIIETVFKIFGGKLVEKPHYHIEALELTERVLTVARDYLKKKEDEESDCDFNTAFTQELLRKLDTKITDECGKIKDRLKFTSEYRLDIYLTACGYAIPKFRKMNKNFRDRHDPRLYLEKNVKGPLYTLYKNQYYQAEAEDAVSDTLCSHLEEPIRTQLREKIGVKMVSMMKANDKLFSSKMSLKVKILSDLLEKDEFKKYMDYLLDVEGSIFQWIRFYTLKYCDEDVDGSTRLENVSKSEVEELIIFVESKLDELPQSNVQEWVEAFSENSSLKKKLGANLQAEDILAGYETQKLNLDNFKQHIRLRLKALRDEIKSSFNGVHCENEMQDWRDKPHDLLKNLIGCTEQCPFCGEQCDLGEDHYPGCRHYTKIHRSGCLAGFRNTITQIMVTEFCPAKVSDKVLRFRTSRTNWEYHLYSDYASIYPEWSIDEDPSSSESLYWKWFAGKYMIQLAERFNAKPANDLEKWATTSKEKVRENLKTLYNF